MEWIDKMLEPKWHLDSKMNMRNSDIQMTIKELYLPETLLVTIGKSETGEKKLVFFKIVQCEQTPFIGKQWIQILGEDTVTKYEYLSQFKTNYLNFFDKRAFTRHTFVVLQEQEKLVRLHSIQALDITIRCPVFEPITRKRILVTPIVPDTVPDGTTKECGIRRKMIKIVNGLNKRYMNNNGDYADIVHKEFSLALKDVIRYNSNYLIIGRPHSV
jgi:hypothetical protein